jgi:hypothetical protein
MSPNTSLQQNNTDIILTYRGDVNNKMLSKCIFFKPIESSYGSLVQTIQSIVSAIIKENGFSK